MGQFFRDDLHDEFGTWAFGYTDAGGLDVGEVAGGRPRRSATATTPPFSPPGPRPGDRLADEAATALARGHRAQRASAPARASSTCGPARPMPAPTTRSTATRPTRAWWRPSAPRLPPSTRGWRCCRCRRSRSRIPFEGAALPGYLLRCRGPGERARRPLVILTNGYDATVTEMYFASGCGGGATGLPLPLLRRPGPGRAADRAGGSRLRPNWETVIGPVVDFALGLDGHRPRRRITLSGWSLGGRLALRAAGGRAAPRRLRIADPGLRAALDPAGAGRASGSTPPPSPISTPSHPRPGRARTGGGSPPIGRSPGCC